MVVLVNALMSETSSWLRRLCAWSENAPQAGVLALKLPAYRPDLLLRVCMRLSLEHVDFRARHMLPLGWEAAKMTTCDLDAVIAELADNNRKVMLSNVEALLSLIGPQERVAWFERAFSRSLRGRMILPLMLYASETPATADSRCYAFSPLELPEETLLDRVASLA
jgi:hypothetical protein